MGLMLIDAGNADECQWSRWFDVSKLLQVRRERRAPASAAPSLSSSARAPLAPRRAATTTDEMMIFGGIDDAGTEERTASSPARAGAATARARVYRMVRATPVIFSHASRHVDWAEEDLDKLMYACEKSVLTAWRSAVVGAIAGADAVSAGGVSA